MLNGDNNENGFETNRSNEQKNKLHVQHPFPLISKKQICTCSKLFCLSLAVVLYDYNAVLYGEMTVVLSYVKQQPASAFLRFKRIRKENGRQ